MKYSHGTLPHTKMMRSIELYGTRVMPLVREALTAGRDEIKTAGAQAAPTKP